MQNHISIAINAVLPMFLIIGTGYLVRRAGRLDEADLQKFNEVGFRLFLPCHLFMTIWRADFRSTIPPSFMVLVVACTLLVFLLAAVFTQPMKGSPQRGVLIQGIFRSNFILIGIPLITYLCGEESSSATSVVISVIVPLFNVLAVTALCVFKGERVSLRKVLKDILTTPLVLGSILGFSARLLQLPLDSFPPLMSALNSLSQIATPLLLFILGASFQSSGVSRYKGLLSICLIVRLVIVPFFAMLTGSLMGFRGQYLCILLAVFGSPCASSSYILAQQMGGDVELAEDIVVIGTAVSCFSMSVWITVLKQLALI